MECILRGERGKGMGLYSGRKVISDFAVLYLALFLDSFSGTHALKNAVQVEMQ